MSKISQLKKTLDPVKTAEADHEGSKIALRISPLATFLLEAGLHDRLGGTKTRAATVLFEAAIHDWATAEGIDPESDEFKAKYLQWLTRQPLTVDELDQWDLEDAAFVRDVEAGNVLRSIKL